VQEALLRGGQTGRNERGRRMTTRPVKAVDADLKINRRLWELAEAFSRNGGEARGRLAAASFPIRRP
jgi:hypothetical protein